MKGLERTFNNEKLKVIWIGFQDRDSKIKNYAKKHNIQEGVCYDKDDLISKKFGIRYGAGLVVINGDGIVKARLGKGFSGKKLHETVKAAVVGVGQ